MIKNLYISTLKNQDQNFEVTFSVMLGAVSGWAAKFGRLRIPSAPCVKILLQLKYIRQEANYLLTADACLPLVLQPIFELESTSTSQWD